MNSETSNKGSASAAWVVAQTGIGVCIGIAMFLAFRSARSVQVDERETIDALAPLRLLDRLRLVAESAPMTTAESGLRWRGGNGESAQYGNRTHAGSQQNQKEGGESYRSPAFFWIGGFIPISREIVSPELTLEFENLGKERVGVDAGKFLATRYRIYRHQKDKGRMPFLEVWTSPDVQPLGIVMARWRGEWLRLCQQTTHNNAEGEQGNGDRKPDADTLVTMASDPQFTRKCSSCHFVDIGGEDVTLDDSNVISGTSLKFPDVLYHWRTASMKFDERAEAGVVDDGKTRVLPDSVRIQRSQKPETLTSGFGKGEVLLKASGGGASLAILDLKQNGAPFILTPNLGRGRVFVRLRADENSKVSSREDLEQERSGADVTATSAKADEEQKDP